MTKAGFRRLVTVLLVVAVLVAAGAFFIPKLTYHCDNCDKFCVGAGYSANILSDAISSISGRAAKVLCEDCAAQEHALAIATGKTIEDFKLPLNLFGAEGE